MPRVRSLCCSLPVPILHRSHLPETPLAHKLAEPQQAAIPGMASEVASAACRPVMAGKHQSAEATPSQRGVLSSREAELGAPEAQAAAQVALAELLAEVGVWTCPIRRRVPVRQTRERLI